MNRVHVQGTSDFNGAVCSGYLGNINVADLLR